MATFTRRAKRQATRKHPSHSFWSSVIGPLMGLHCSLHRGMTRAQRKARKS